MLVTLIGKVLGLYRDRLLAIHYSTGPAASAFLPSSVKTAASLHWFCPSIRGKRLLCSLE